MPLAVEAATTSTLFDSLAPQRRRLQSLDDEIVRTQVALAEIPAPTGSEEARAAEVARRMRVLGLAVRFDEAGNVIGRREGRLPGAHQVAVCAHLDTVFPGDADVRVRDDGGRLWSPGIGDNARGLAGMLALARIADGETLVTDRPIDFVATVGEEALGDLRGAKHYFATAGRDAAAAIMLDGAGDERVVHRAVGSRRYRLRFTGQGGHSWSAYGLANPLHAAACAAAALAALIIPQEPRSALTVARIAGGLSINAIPGDALVEVDLRSVSQEVLERLDGEIRRAADVAVAQENARRAHGTPPLRAQVERLGDRPGGQTSAHHPLVVAAIEATRLIGREPELAAASTDANVPMALGIPAIALGAGGRGGDAHTLQEWYENSGGTLGIARALTVLCAAANEGR